MNVKDNFSAIAGQYAAWRPEYPETLFAYLSSLATGHQRALDCGTGNGQAAKGLAKYFANVFATDISEEQIRHAVQLPNIQYSISAAEKTDFPAQYFDLICAAQAAHWFNHPVFYKEMERISKPGAVLALIGYGLVEIGPETDAVIRKLYKDILGPYWDAERRFIDDHYKSLPFPYEEIAVPPFQINCSWNLEQLTGYLGTWSALNNYIRKQGSNPLDSIIVQLKKAWGNEDNIRQVSFPVIAKVAAINLR